MTGLRSGVCTWCGASFEVVGTRGPVPRYCRPAHRTRAYEQRRLTKQRPQVEAHDVLERLAVVVGERSDSSKATKAQLADAVDELLVASEAVLACFGIDAKPATVTAKSSSGSTAPRRRRRPRNPPL